MRGAPSPPWTLRCAWCPYAVEVNARGMRGNDPGSGVEAARLMTRHVNEQHGKAWSEYLRETEETSKWT